VRSLLAAFEVSLLFQSKKLEEVSVLRRRGPTIGFVAALALFAASPAARAQTNIDQGKSSAEIFANDCAACHKSIRGLANGKNSLMLSAFLREHYTASREQAAALAAYVLGNGGGAPAPAGQKPGRAAAEEPKTGAKAGEPKAGEPKTASRPTRAATKPAEEAPADAQPQRPTEEDRRPSTASHDQKEPEAVRPAPASAIPAAAPPANETPSVAQPTIAQPTVAQPAAPRPAATTSAAAPAELQPSDSEPVPRDNIPD